MKLATVALFVLPFLCKDTVMARAKRAILNDLNWLSEADLAQKLPISEKVMESPTPSFFHLGADGDLSDLSETLEIELDHAMDRKWDGDNEGAKSKREAVPSTPEVEREVFSLMPEASAVKQMKTEICNNAIEADRRNLLDESLVGEPFPMKVKGEHRRNNLVPKEAENGQDLSDEIVIIKPVPMKVEGEHRRNDLIPSEAENGQDLSDEIVIAKPVPMKVEGERQRKEKKHSFIPRKYEKTF